MRLLTSRYNIIILISTILLSAPTVTAYSYATPFPFVEGATFTWDIVEYTENGIARTLLRDRQIFVMDKLVYTLTVIDTPQNWDPQYEHISNYLQLALETPDGQIVDYGGNPTEFLFPTLTENEEEAWYHSEMVSYNAVISEHVNGKTTVIRAYSSDSSQPVPLEVTEMHVDANSGLLYYYNHTHNGMGFGQTHSEVTKLEGYDERTFRVPQDIVAKIEEARTDYIRQQRSMIVQIIGYIALMLLLPLGTTFYKVNRRRGWMKLPVIKFGRRWKTDNGSTEMKPNMQRVQQLITERRCCRLSGRLGDRFCDLCGRLVPIEMVIIAEME